jgi:hypothetical protein
MKSCKLVEKTYLSLIFIQNSINKYNNSISIIILEQIPQPRDIIIRDLIDQIRILIPIFHLLDNLLNPLDLMHSSLDHQGLIVQILPEQDVSVQAIADHEVSFWVLDRLVLEENITEQKMGLPHDRGLAFGAGFKKKSTEYLSKTLPLNNLGAVTVLERYSVDFF